MSARPPAILAIDLGTTAVKAGLVGLDGTVHASARADAGVTIADAPGVAEQDANGWWDAITRATRELTSKRVADVVAVAADGHGPTLVPVDARGAPVARAITWLDTRSTAELGELADASGLRGWALGVLPAALWLERHEPEIAARTAWYLNTWEYVAMRLSGSAVATRVEGQELASPDVVGRAGLDLRRIPEAVVSGTVVGSVTGDASAALGIPRGTPVVAGMVDAFASFHGAGLLDAGDAIDTGGVSGGFGVYWPSPVDAPGSFCTPAPLPGMHIVGGAMAATGRALDWFIDDVLGGVVSRDALIAEAAATAPGADGLVFLPYLAGERSPLWDPRATGAFVGLTVRHGRAHMTRAILEAAALAIRHVARPILATGVAVDAMRVCGGPARSATWNRIKADVTRFRVLVPHVVDTTVLGMGIAGAVAIGAQPDMRTAIRAMTRVDHTIDPDAALGGVYDDLFDAYVGLHPALAPVLEPPATAVVAG
jgi:xylulokinase